VEPGVSGTRLTLTGRVLGINCQPVPGAVVDLWHANAAGVYDNEGFQLRGRLQVDQAGRYRFETIMPKGYPTGANSTRTAHFHVKVAAHGRRVLTTELYFPDYPENKKDSSFNPARLIKMKDATHGQTGTFDFVLA
jgi:protocatechuate 3,4-dioxygenase beta subunit